MPTQCPSRSDDVHQSSHPPASSAWPAVTSLLTTSRSSLDDSARAVVPAERYAAAHLSALRAAAAVLAARARPEAPGRSRGRPASAWVLLSAVAPELTEWAAFFASGAAKRSAAEAGISQAVTTREADDLLREAETFLLLVEKVVGVSLAVTPLLRDSPRESVPRLQESHGLVR